MSVKLTENRIQRLKCPAGRKDMLVFDDEQRYALIKLGDAKKPSHNLEPALREFFSKD